MMGLTFFIFLILFNIIIYWAIFKLLIIEKNKLIFPIVLIFIGIIIMAGIILFVFNFKAGLFILALDFIISMIFFGSIFVDVNKL